MNIKRFFPLLLLCLTGTVAAQNIQLHYDFGRPIYSRNLAERPRMTATIEHFGADKWGSTFFFVDMDLSSSGMKAAYTEIAREIQWWSGALSAHVEYNGGLNAAFSFNDAYLVGATYTHNNEDYTLGYTLTPMYKYIRKHHRPHNFQVTATWYWHFADKLYSFSGYADYWREATVFGKMIFMSEPQFWVNLNRIKGVDEKFNLSVGTEVEISANFLGRGWYAIPTLALKWTL
jgi:hypothetical protein